MLRIVAFLILAGAPVVLFPMLTGTLTVEDGLFIVVCLVVASTLLHAAAGMEENRPYPTGEEPSPACRE